MLPSCTKYLLLFSKPLQLVNQLSRSFGPIAKLAPQIEQPDGFFVRRKDTEWNFEICVTVAARFFGFFENILFLSVTAS